MKTLSAFIILLFFCFANVSAQTTLRIISATDHAPLPYATIVNTTQRTMHSSDDSGFVKMNVHTGDTINVTYIGYLPAMMICNDQPNTTLILQRDLKTMKPVTVATCRMYEQIAVADFEEKEKAFMKAPPTGGVVWSIIPGIGNAHVAMLLTSPRPDVLLSKFSFWLRKNVYMPDSAIKSPMLVSFYGVSETDSLPGELLTDKPVICFPKKAGRQTIDLDSFHIRIPVEGIYVCFQWVIDERFQYPMNYKTDSSESVIMYQGLMLDCVRAVGHQLVFYDVFNGGWFKSGSRNKKVPANDEQVRPAHLPSTIRYEAVLKYCK